MEPTQTHSRRYRRAALLGGVLASACTAGASLLLWWSLSGLASAHHEDIPVAEAMVLLTGLTTGLVAAALAYTSVAGALALKAMASGDSGTERRITPRLAARSAAVLLVLVMGTPGASAETSPLDRHPCAGTVASAGLDDRYAGTMDSTTDSAHSVDSAESTPGASDPPRPVPLPGWQSTRADPPTDATEADPSTAAVVVQRGDTLWGIAAADLAPGASDAEIAEHWPRWYQANRLTIGPHPDLILPGHILQPPTPRGAHP